MSLHCSELSPVIFNQVVTHSNGNKDKSCALSQTEDDSAWSREGLVTLANVSCVLK